MLAAERVDGARRFSVRGQGRGIPADKLETIFARAFPTGGRLAEQHGGKIWVESVLGQGSTFYFTIPLQEEESPERVNSGPRVLVCDDDESVRKILEAMLESRGYDVITADCGSKAIELAQSTGLARLLRTTFENHGVDVFHAVEGEQAIALTRDARPDLLVLDVVLPDMDGFQVVKSLQRDPVLRRIPLAVYSGTEIPAGDRFRLELGATEFFVKSRVAPEQFEERVMGMVGAMVDGGSDLSPLYRHPLATAATMK